MAKKRSHSLVQLSGKRRDSARGGAGLSGSAASPAGTMRIIRLASKHQEGGNMRLNEYPLLTISAHA